MEGKQESRMDVMIADPLVEQSTNKQQNYGSRPPCFTSTFQEVLFVVTCTMAIAMSSMVAGAVSVISSFVGRDLDMSTAEITWLSAASSLAAGSFLLMFGGLADLFGRRSMFIGSLFLFSIFSLASGFAKKPLELDALSGLLGLVSASAVPPAQGMLGAIYHAPSRRKNAAFACYSAGNPLGFVFGMVSAGLASAIFDWRAAYWFLAIIYVGLTVVAVLTMPKDDSTKRPLTWNTLKSFDLLGVLLTIAGTGGLSAGLSLGSDHGWSTNYVLCLIILGFACLVAFVFWELYCKFPLVDMVIFRNRDFSLLLITLLLGLMSFSSSAFWLSLFIQRIWQASSLMTAVYLLPMAIGGTIVNIVAGAILHRVSNKLLMGVGAAAYTLANLFYALNKPNYTFWGFVFVGQLLSVTGADLQFNVVNMYVMSSMKKEQQSTAGGLFQMVTKLCNAIGMGMSTAIFDGVSRSMARNSISPEDATKPYTATFWMATTACGLSLVFVPFLTIKTQGDMDSSSEQDVVHEASVTIDTKGESDSRNDATKIAE